MFENAWTLIEVNDACVPLRGHGMGGALNVILHQHSAPEKHERAAMHSELNARRNKNNKDGLAKKTITVIVKMVLSPWTSLPSRRIGNKKIVKVGTFQPPYLQPL